MAPNWIGIELQYSIDLSRLMHMPKITVFDIIDLILVWDCVEIARRQCRASQEVILIGVY